MYDTALKIEEYTNSWNTAKYAKVGKTIFSSIHIACISMLFIGLVVISLEIFDLIPSFWFCFVMIATAVAAFIVFPTSMIADFFEDKEEKAKSTCYKLVNEAKDKQKELDEAYECLLWESL